MKKIIKNNSAEIGARHGDLSFHPLEVLPQGIKEVRFDGSFILARGEHTGHKHIITAPKKALRIFQDVQGRYVLEVKEAATITHEEHAPITLLPGIYQHEQESERDPFLDKIRQVAD